MALTDAQKLKALQAQLLEMREQIDLLVNYIASKFPDDDDFPLELQDILCPIQIDKRIFEPHGILAKGSESGGDANENDDEEEQFDYETLDNLIGHVEPGTDNENNANGGPRPYKCQHCGNSYSRRDNLTTHIKTHASKTEFECLECGKIFIRKHHLDRHVSNVHTRNKKISKLHRRNPNIKPHVCGTCGKRFTRRDHLTRHARSIHIGLKPYTCQLCKKSFPRNDYLTEHYRKIHQLEREEVQDEEFV